MARMERSIIINAPAEKIFQFITNDPVELTKVWPNLEEVWDVQSLPDGRKGKRFRFAYRMAGVRVEGTSETLQCVPNQLNVNRTKGGVESTVKWVFQPENGEAKTRVTLESEYTVSIPLVGKLLAALVASRNQRGVDKLLSNLKTRLED